MLDFPGMLSCILWFSGCNLACSYCYNPEFLKESGKIDLEGLLSFLRSRVGLLEGVVFSGGEATLFAGLPLWMEEVRSLGFKIKLDTNGTNPAMLKELLQKGYLDYVAMDFKGKEERFGLITGREFYGRFLESLEILLSSSIPFEIRTTVHSYLLQEEDIVEMAALLKERGYKGAFYLQHFVGEKETLKPLPESRRLKLDEEAIETKIIWR